MKLIPALFPKSPLRIALVAAGALIVAACVLTWGTTWYAITFQLGATPPEVGVASRFALAGSVRSIGEFMLVHAVLIGLFVRLSLEESPVFQEAKAEIAEKQHTESHLPILEVIRTYPREVFIAMGMRMAENISYYIFTVISITFMTTYLGGDKDVILQMLLIGAVAGAARPRPIPHRCVRRPGAPVPPGGGDRPAGAAQGHGRHPGQRPHLGHRQGRHA